MQDFISSAHVLPEKLFGQTNIEKIVEKGDNTVQFDSELVTAESDDQVKKFEQIEGLKYKMLEEDDAYITDRSDRQVSEEGKSDMRVVEEDVLVLKPNVSVADSVVNPHIPLHRLFVTPESINRYLQTFSVETRGIITETVQVIQARLADGKVSHTFSFNQSGVHVQFQQDGDVLLVRVTGDLPLSTASEELIKNQIQLHAYLQEIFPDKELVVKLEPDSLFQDKNQNQSDQSSEQDNQTYEEDEKLDED